MKNFKKTILTAAMLVSAFNLIPANIMHISAVDFKMPADKGDVNNDTLVDAIDASLVLADYAFVSTGNESSFDEKQSYSADVNEDDKIDAIDASLILAHYAFIATGGENNDTPTVITTTPVTTTVPVTTTTAQQTTVTTQSTTIPPKTEYVLEDIKTDPEAYLYFAEKMRKELYNDKMVFGKFGASKGYAECMIMLAILNIGINGETEIEPEVLAYRECLGRFFYNTIIEYCEIADFASIMQVTGGKIDFTEYMFDKDMAKYMNDISEKSLIVLNAGDDTELKNSIAEYNKKLLTVGENNLKYYEIMFTTHALYYPYVVGDVYRRPIATEDAYMPWKEKMIERDINPWYNNYSQYIGEKYTSQ